MPYPLYFYSFPAEDLSRVPSSASAVAEFIRSVARLVGRMEFGPGEFLLLLNAAEELTGMELMGLLESPLGDCEPTEKHSFGGLIAEDARLLVSELDRVFAQVDERTAGLHHLAEVHDFTPERLLGLLRELRDLIQQALKAGGEIVTLYC